MGNGASRARNGWSALSGKRCCSHLATRGAALRASAAGAAEGTRCQNAADTKAAPRVRWEGSRADRAQRARPRETEGARRAALRVRARKTAARHRESLAGSEEPERRGDSRRRRGGTSRRGAHISSSSQPSPQLRYRRAALEQRRGAAPCRGADPGGAGGAAASSAAHAGSLPSRRAARPSEPSAGPCRAGCRAGWGRTRAGAARRSSPSSKEQPRALPFGGSTRRPCGIRVLFAIAKHLLPQQAPGLSLQGRRHLLLKQPSKERDPFLLQFPSLHSPLQPVCSLLLPRS